MNKGIYQLSIFLPKSSLVQIGRKGQFIFPPGYYIYTGSTEKNLSFRIKRHHSKQKKFFGHIDYFLKYGRILQNKIYAGNKEGEYKLNQKLFAKGETIVPKFGASDCQCKTHSVYFKFKPNL
jgi:Uri superfamily endonuclease